MSFKFFCICLIYQLSFLINIDIALVKNNALVGAKVAVALAKTREHENKGR